MQRGSFQCLIIVCTFVLDIPFILSFRRFCLLFLVSIHVFDFTIWWDVILFHFLLWIYFSLPLFHLGLKSELMGGIVWLGRFWSCQKHRFQGFSFIGIFLMILFHSSFSGWFVSGMICFSSYCYFIINSTPLFNCYVHLY